MRHGNSTATRKYGQADAKTQQAADWYERTARSLGRIGVDKDLANEAADRFGALRSDVYAELCFRI